MKSENFEGTVIWDILNHFLQHGCKICKTIKTKNIQYMYVVSPDLFVCHHCMCTHDSIYMYPKLKGVENAQIRSTFDRS